VLMDLLGAANAPVYNFFANTKSDFDALFGIQSRLRAAKLLMAEGNHLFASHQGGSVQDDHIPFLNRGVRILHLIPPQFPSQWHRVEDDVQHLDVKTVADWATMMRQFVFEYLNLFDKA